MSERRTDAGVERRSTRAELLRLFRHGHILTYEEVTEHLPITSERHARRLINQIRSAGVAIRESKRGRKKEFSLAPEDRYADAVELNLTEQEALALVVAVDAARSGLGQVPLQEALESGFETLIEAMSSSIATFEPALLTRHLHFGEAASSAVDPGVFLDLVEALSNRQTVSIDYHTARSDTYHKGRPIEPWGLAVRGNAWLCVARDPEKDAMRDFNLSRIENVRPADPSSRGGDYAIPSDFDLEMHFIDRFEALEGKEVFLIRLLVEPSCVPYFRSKRYHRTQQIHEEEGGEGVVVSYEVAGLDEIASFVRSWGIGVMVLDPPELAERIAVEAQKVADQYDRSRDWEGGS
jgi:predicted DNA-binding transcriptional regulator YafY